MAKFLLSTVFSLWFVCLASLFISESISAFKKEEYFGFGFWLMLAVWNAINLAELLIET